MRAIKIDLVKSIKKAAVYVEEDIVYKVNDELLKLVGYKAEEIVGKSLRELSVLLKTTFQTCFEEMDSIYNLYIFNNENVPKNVTITCERLVENNKKTYKIEENVNSTLNWLILNFDNLEIDDKTSVVLYSYPNLINLKSNKRYVESFNSEYYKSSRHVGRGSIFSRYILNTLKNKNKFHEQEMEFRDSKGKVNYWDINLKVLSGSGNEEYLIAYFYDVTEKVVKEKMNERKRIEMQTILDNISDSVNKVNNKGQFTYLNKSAINKMSACTSDLSPLDDKEQYRFFKYNDIDGNELSFEDTPVQRVLRGETIVNEIIVGTSHLSTTYHECNANPIYDDLGNLDGGVFVYRDIADIFKIEEYNVFKENMI